VRSKEMCEPVPLAQSSKPVFQRRAELIGAVMSRKVTISDGHRLCRRRDR
jgi:hypothetical protein